MYYRSSLCPFTNSIILDVAKADVELFDWCYVYNFFNSYTKINAVDGDSVSSTDETLCRNVDEFSYEKRAYVENDIKRCSRIFLS